MKYCVHCGSVMEDDQLFCKNCGAKAESNTSDKTTEAHVANEPVKEEKSEEKTNVGLAILSVFFPIVGIILACCYWNSKPNPAKTYLICAILGIAITASSFYRII